MSPTNEITHLVEGEIDFTKEPGKIAWGI